MHIDTSIKQNEGELRYRLIAESDLPKLCELMAEVGASFAGLTLRSMRFAICSDALTNSKATIVVADHDGDIIGFAIAVVDATAYWKGFLLCHPVIALRILIHKFDGIASEKIENHWNESSPSVARILYVGVAQRFRNKGVGTRLYLFLFNALSEHGIRLVEAHLDSDNIPAIRLFSGVGGRIVKRPTICSAILELGSRDEKRVAIDEIHV